MKKVTESYQSHLYENSLNIVTDLIKEQTAFNIKISNLEDELNKERAYINSILTSKKYRIVLKMASLYAPIKRLLNRIK